jgi:hypothetical protein
MTIEDNEDDLFRIMKTTFEDIEQMEGSCPPDVKKVVFLDIGGVLKPEGRGESYALVEKGELNNLPNELYKRLKIDYSQYSLFQTASIYYDWDKGAVSLLKEVLIKTGARIVLSSDWRLTYPMGAMYDFFAIHGLQNFYIDNTMYINRDKERKYYELYWEEANGFLNLRVIEILEYIKRHRHITHYVAIDDINLTRGLEDHFVRTETILTPYHAEKAMEILSS